MSLFFFFIGMRMKYVCMNGNIFDSLNNSYGLHLQITSDNTGKLQTKNISISALVMNHIRYVVNRPHHLILDFSRFGERF